jgi:hypothetical protein
MHNVYLVRLHLFATWAGLLAGVSSGAVMGLLFHREDWLGGYGSFPRRLIRLGHISFFGLALVNALFALTVALTPLPELAAHCASIGFLVGAITMPLCCFLSAWRERCRCLFPLPVGSLFAGASFVLFILLRS